MVALEFYKCGKEPAESLIENKLRTLTRVHVTSVNEFRLMHINLMKVPVLQKKISLDLVVDLLKLNDSL